MKQKLDSLPITPGVYLFKDVRGKVLYVGKASILRHRVRSYFQAGGARSPWIAKLLRQIADLDYISTRSEKEALILEGNLIKMHRPPFNIRFKDDKRFPYLKIPLDEPYPPLVVVRTPKDDGALYFGPYASGKAMNETVELIKRLFGLRSLVLVGDRRATGCPWRDTSKPIPRACLEYHVLRCCGPCVKAVSKEDYQARVREVCAFLEGKHTAVVEQLRRQMWEAAERQEFEKAAQIRDQIEAVENVIERQTVVLGIKEDIDAFTYAQKLGLGCIQMVMVRSGKLMGNQHFLIQVEEGREVADILGSFIKQHYSAIVHIPKTVLLPCILEDAKVVSEWLSDKRGGQVEVKVPERGQLRELMQMAQQNAEQALWAELEREETERRATEAALSSLQKHLCLPNLPYRIECFDISNIHGHQAVGSLVVFEGGKPSKRFYRRFRIRTHEGAADDFAMMREVLHRRLQRLIDGDERFGAEPDLLLVDGGRGQLSCALEVLRELKLERIAAAGLAKEQEVIYRPHSPLPIVLPFHSPALHLLQRIRDEAHRFAITHHRTRRRNVTVKSVLDDAPSIGEVRKRSLLQHFGSLEAIKSASVEELSNVPHMSRQAAQALWMYLHRE